jgi:late competence protein required for DNA uptake (superfamily II DNA/RNA helicase)
MKCVRCAQDQARKIADAPDGSGAWEVYYCLSCNYVWRSSEESEIINMSERNPDFQLHASDLERLTNPVPIPPLRKKERA